MYDEKNDLEIRREACKKTFKEFEKCIRKNFDDLDIEECKKSMVKWYLNDSRYPEDAIFWFGAYYMKDLYNL